MRALNFITDALVVRGADLAQGPVDVAIVNSTAIATGLALVSGAGVTFRQWFAVLPFADTLQVTQVTDAELAIILDNRRQDTTALTFHNGGEEDFRIAKRSSRRDRGQRPMHDLNWQHSVHILAKRPAALPANFPRAMITLNGGA